MPSTYTLNNGIELIATGEQSGTWGDTTNTNLELLDTALDGQVTISLASAGSSGSPNTLPISDGTASNGRNRMVIFDDSSDLGATAYVQLTPNDAEKIIYVRNSLSGSRSILLFQGTYNASNDYELKAGTTAVIFFDGAGSGAVAANVLSDLQVENLSVFGTAPTITLTDTDTGVDTELNAASSVGQFTLNIDKNNEGSSPRLVTQISGTEFFRINESGAVFNESSEDQDFRVESNGASHMLFVDAGNNRIGIGQSAPETPLHLTTSSAGTAFIIESTDAGASDGPTLNLWRNSASPVDGDGLGVISFQGEDNLGGRTTFGQIRVEARDVTSGTEDGLMSIRTTKDGTDVSRLNLNQDAAVFNEGGLDIDFRVESDTEQYALFVDASANNVGVKTSVPSESLHVTGNTRLDANNNGTSRGGAGNTIILRDNDTATASGQPVGEIEFYTSDSDNAGVNSRISVQATGTGAAGKMTFETGTAGSLIESLAMSDGNVTFNEGGNDIDFRVESNNNANMLFVDATNDRVGVNRGSPNYTLDVQGDAGIAHTGGVPLTIDGTSAGGIAYVPIANVATSATGNGAGVELRALSTVQERQLAYLTGEWTDNTDATRSAQLHLRTTILGAGRKMLSANSSEIVMNEDGRSIDFRVESDSNTDMLRVNGTLNRVGVGLNPSHVFHAEGSTSGDWISLIKNTHSSNGYGLKVQAGDNNDVQPFRVANISNDTLFYVAGGGRAVFNDVQNTTADVNIKGNTMSGLFYADVSTNRIGLNTTTPNSLLQVNGEAEFNRARVVDNGSTSPLFNIKSDDATPWSLQIQNDTYNTSESYGFRGFVNNDNNAFFQTNGNAEYNYIQFAQRNNTTTVGLVDLGRNSATTFNEDGADVDFRVESDNNANMFLVDAGADSVLFGNTGGSSGTMVRINHDVDGGETAAALHIQGAGYTGFHWLDSTGYYIGQNSTIRQMRIYSGAETAGVALTNGSTSWGTFSDERLKENVEPVENALQSLSGLRTVKYHLKDVDGPEDKKKIGVIAQDLVGVLDEVIDPTFRTDDDTEYMGVRYTELVPVLIKAIQEQQTMIETLEARITALENA